jgi:Flp pilus assembly protein TadD
VLAYHREEYGLAVTEMACAASLEPGNGTILCNLGAALCRAGDPRLARRWLERGRAAAPTSPDVLVALGNAYALQGRYEEALETENEAARTAEISGARHNAALLLAARRHLPAALEEQRSAFELAPNDPDVLNNLGCLLWLRGRYVEAAPHFERAAETRYHETARGNLVRADLAAGRFEAARHLILTTSYADEEREFDRGLVHLLAAMQEEPRDGSPPTPEIAYELSEASACFREVVECGRGPVTESHINLGIVDYVHLDYESAAASFAAAAASAPGSLELEYPIGVCYLMAAGRLLGPESPSDQPPSGSVLDLMNRARPHLEKALGAQDVADAAHLNLGVVHYVLGDYEKAIERLRPIARPDSPWEIQNVMAIAQARRARQLQVSIQSDPLLRAVKKGYIRTQIGKLLSAAIHAFGHVLRHEPHNAVAHANIGLAHYLRNRGDDVELALQHWQRMRQTGGEWGERVFERFSIAMSSDGADRLNFQDIEVTFRPLPVRDWVTCPAPRMAGLQYVVRELADDQPPQFEPQHRMLRRALACRDRVARLRAVLRRLT